MAMALDIPSLLNAIPRSGDVPERWGDAGLSAMGASGVTTLRSIGFWGNGRYARWPDPRRFVDPSWDPEERAAVIAYVRRGRDWAPNDEPVGLVEDCKICDRPIGSGEVTDGSYVWADGLAHYLEVHDVRLPDEFTEHVLGRLGAPMPSDAETRDLAHSAREDDRWWKTMRELPG